MRIENLQNENRKYAKSIGNFLGKALKGAVTKETAVKPEYVGEGCLVLEPTNTGIGL